MQSLISAVVINQMAANQLDDYLTQNAAYELKRVVHCSVSSFKQLSFRDLDTGSLIGIVHTLVFLGVCIRRSLNKQSKVLRKVLWWIFLQLIWPKLTLLNFSEVYLIAENIINYFSCTKFWYNATTSDCRKF